MTAKLLCHAVTERINTTMCDKYTNLSMEQQYCKYRESTAPFQVYFQTPREGSRKVCKVILNITYIYDPAGHLDILRACSNSPDLRQDTLVCALEPRSLSCLGQLTSLVSGAKFLYGNAFLLQKSKASFFLISQDFPICKFFFQEYASETLQHRKNLMDGQFTKKVSNFFSVVCLLCRLQDWDYSFGCCMRYARCACAAMLATW